MKRTGKTDCQVSQVDVNSARESGETWFPKVFVQRRIYSLLSHAQSSLNPIQPGNRACAEKQQPALTRYNNDSTDNFQPGPLRQPLGSCRAHLKYVHLLHFSQSGSLEQDAQAGRGAGRRAGPGLWHGQVNAGSRFDIARTSLSQAGQRSKRWEGGGEGSKQHSKEDTHKYPVQHFSAEDATLISHYSETLI